MYWEVGIKIGAESGQVTVHPAALLESEWSNAVEHALEMATALYPQQRIELEWVKEYETTEGSID
tara:strand:+ start:2232 stop:2426 length:195 start_codon:yes stop_codon:yes gene_type:complete